MAAAPIRPVADACPARDSALRRACRGAWEAAGPPRGAALILTGGCAAEPPAWRAVANGWRLVGDVDLLVIWPRGGPRSSWLADFARGIGQRLHAVGLSAELSARAGDGRFLERLPASLWRCDLRARAETLAGTPVPLAALRAHAASEPPPEEGWRLLNNRMVEWLAERAAPLRSAEARALALVRLQMGMGASWLIFAQRYTTGAAAQGQALGRLAAEPGAEARWPFSPAELRAIVEQARHAKWEGSEPPGWASTIRVLRPLWRWQLRRLAGGPTAASDTELLRGWAGRRPGRWRTWASLMRHAAHGQWARELVCWLARGSAPRPWLYGRAAQLLFAPPPTSPSEVAAWRAQARAVAAAYHRYVVPTGT